MIRNAFCQEVFDGNNKRLRDVLPKRRVEIDNELSKLREIWPADYKKLNPIIEKQEHRCPNLSAFKDAGKPIYKDNTFDDMGKKLKPA